MCRLYGKVCVLFRTRLIFSRINSPNICSNKRAGFLICQQITTADFVYKRLPPAGRQEIRPSRFFVCNKLTYIPFHHISYIFGRSDSGPIVEPKTSAPSTWKTLWLKTLNNKTVR